MAAFKGSTAVLDDLAVYKEQPAAPRISTSTPKDSITSQEHQEQTPTLFSHPKTISNMPTEGQIAGGHKANLKNPNTSKESKENSKKIPPNYHVAMLRLLELRTMSATRVMRFVSRTLQVYGVKLHA